VIKARPRSAVIRGAESGFGPEDKIRGEPTECWQSVT